MAVFSAAIVLADKHLVTRRQTTIQLHALYSVSDPFAGLWRSFIYVRREKGLFQPWGTWTPFRILVVRDLWLAVLRLAREGGDDCHAILLQLAAKWTFIRDLNPMFDLPLQPDPEVISQLRTHVKLSRNFAASLKTTFARYQGTRRVRQSREELEADRLLVLDGDSSVKMEQVWEVWENTNRPRIENITVGPVRRWAWNQRASTCPPLHRSFRRENLPRPEQLKAILEKLEAAPEEPQPEEPQPGKPFRPKRRNIDHPFTVDELAGLRPFQDPPPQVGPVVIAVEEDEVEVPALRRSARLAADAPPEEEEEEQPKARSSNGGGGWSSGGGRRKNSQGSKAPGKAVLKIEDNALGMPHPVWDITDIDIGPRPESTTLDKVSIRMGNGEPPLTVLFLSGMVSRHTFIYLSHKLRAYRRP